MKKNTGKQRITLMGLLTASDWDDDGNVTGVKFSAIDESEYDIGGSVKIKKLIKHLQKPVRLTGTIQTVDKDVKLFNITRCEPITNYEENDLTVDS